MDVVAQDLARASVGDQAQVQRAALARQVGDIGDPLLLWRAGQYLLWTGFEQVEVAIETVKDMGR